MTARRFLDCLWPFPRIADALERIARSIEGKFITDEEAAQVAQQIEGIGKQVDEIAPTSPQQKGQ